MPYLTLGSASQLQIKVPTNGTTDWGDTLKTDTFQKIAEHNHTGSGTGSQLGTGSIQADAIVGTKIRLANNEYLRARDAANSTDINIVKVNASDLIEFGATIVAATITTLTSTTGTITTLTSPTSNQTQINATGSVTLTDNTSSAADASVITLSADETCKIRAKVTRNGSVSTHTIELDQDNATINEVYSGDSTGVTFSIASDQLQYTTTSTGSHATLTYTIIKE